MGEQIDLMNVWNIGWPFFVVILWCVVGYGFVLLWEKLFGKGQPEDYVMTMLFWPLCFLYGVAHFFSISIVIIYDIIRGQKRDHYF